jgi:hypothetical protein
MRAVRRTHWTCDKIHENFPFTLKISRRADAQHRDQSEYSENYNENKERGHVLLHLRTRKE